MVNIDTANTADHVSPSIHKVSIPEGNKMLVNFITDSVKR